ncbi:hypothetical protein SPRG_02116 [Saprolegnia parasitica CBS 223.65]|uniref:EF-hand domain-containing protein n=1 Tax=Saprolegnia parasitica (strain CBS 223.65) TaxID=695850 RepID=A0A067D2Q4_SAPPC|nr:hypothetical protein SPRG_02116 [Saprolegnia parasitica CBS 223.65]KDO33307.1 hypothetical protein SPRG_02116 [Saprolegnia parasitica CBS 223.65]|eukprot:XP_012196057.1 hypothetical protein SPRG_02116 [Saprolegnia parasitica CBS 223.65]
MSRDAFVELFSSFVHEAQSSVGFDTPGASVLLAKARVALEPLRATCHEAADDVTQLEQRLAHRLAHDGDDRRRFLAMDRQGTGFLSYEDFQRALDRLNMPTEPVTVARLLLKYDRSGRGHVNYTSFLRFRHLSDAPVSTAHAAQAQVLACPSADDLAELERWRHERAMARLRTKLYEKSTSLRQLYLHLDKDRFGALTIDELHDGLASMGILLAKPELDSIAAHCPSRHGLLSLAEFCRLVDTLPDEAPKGDFWPPRLQPPTPTPATRDEVQHTIALDDVDAIRLPLVADLVADGKTARALFVSLCDPQAHAITVHSLELALARRQLHIPPREALVRLLSAYDKTGTGSLALHEFLPLLHP